MANGQFVIVPVLLSFVCFQATAAWWFKQGTPSWEERAEASVCCASKWNSTDTTGGCCGHGWEIHCCDIAMTPPTCCYGPERIHLPIPSDFRSLFIGVVWMNVIVLAMTVVLTLVILYWCCQSFFGLWTKSKVYSSGHHKEHILHSIPNRYGTLLDPVPIYRNDKYAMPMNGTGTDFIPLKPNHNFASVSVKY